MPPEIITLATSITSDPIFNIDDVTHRGFELEHDDDGKIYTFRFQGTRDEMRALVDAHTVNEVHTNYGTLKNIRLTQDVGPNWFAEFRFENLKATSDTEPPDTSYGAKSCRLTGGMLSNPLNHHPDYKMNWDHYLLAKPDTTTIPAWWSTDDNDAIPLADQDTYYWYNWKTPPADKQGWKVLKKPTKPGVTSWDMATYQIVESARYKSASAAGSMVQNKLNKIDTPSNVFGITGGTWKCERAEVSWSGKYWLATLVWVRSTDETGWDTDLSDTVSSGGNS